HARKSGGQGKRHGEAVRHPDDDVADHFSGSEVLFRGGDGDHHLPGYLHSWRRARNGSRRLARRAGTRHASSAIVASSSGVPRYVTGSVALTPNRIVRTKRAKDHAAAQPMARPIPTSSIAPETTRRKTSARPAPTAIRIPISPVLRLTAYDTTPYIPTAASRRPTPA